MFESDYINSTRTPTAYSRHLLKCISKFLPNNPNFCPSIKEIEEEQYFKNCVKNLMALCMDNDTNVLIDDILKLLKDKLSKYEEFPIIQEDEELNDNLILQSSKLSSPTFSSEVKTPPRHSSSFLSHSITNPIKDNNSFEEKSSPTESLPNMPFHMNANELNGNRTTKSGISYTEPHDINNLSNATLKLLDKHTNIRKSTKYPIRSLGISNYVLIFLKLIIQIFEVRYFFHDTSQFSKATAKEKKTAFENSFHLFYTSSRSAFTPLKFGIKNFKTDTEGPLNDINFTLKTRPQKLSSRTFRKMLRFLIAIKSNVKLDDCVSKIVKEDQMLLPNMKNLIFKSLRTSSIHVASNGNYLNHDDEKLDSTPHLANIRNVIDKNVEYIFSFLANSNSQEYMQFLEQILLVNPGPEAVKDNFVLQELKDKYVKHQDLDDIETEKFINEELNNNDTNSLNTSQSNVSSGSNSENNPKFILIPAYLSLFTSDLLFSTEYISFMSFQSIKELTSFIQFIHKLHKTYKRSIFRKCLLLSFAHSLKIFLVTKTKDYLHYTHDNTSPECVILKKELTSLFNTIYGSFDTLSLINDIYGNATGTTMNFKNNQTNFSEKEIEKFNTESVIDESALNHKLFEINGVTNAHAVERKGPLSEKNISKETEYVNQMIELFNGISKDGLALSDPGDAYHFGSCNINDNVLNPGGIAVLRSLTMLSLFNVDVFSNYLNKVEFKGLDSADSLGSKFFETIFQTSENPSAKHLSTYVKNLKEKTNLIDQNKSDHEDSSNNLSSFFISSHLESQTKNVGSVLKNNLLKMSKIPSTFSSNKENKFWSNLLKHFLTPQSSEISDKSNLYIFSSLMLIYSMGGFLSIYKQDSPICVFAKRLAYPFSMIFQLNDYMEIPKHLLNSHIILKRNLLSKTKGAVENMISSLLLFPEETVKILELKCSLATKNGQYGYNTNYEFYCMSEAMKFFFYIPNTFTDEYSVYSRIVNVMKNMTFHLSGHLIRTMSYLDANASQIIDDIIFKNYIPENQDIQFFIGNKSKNNWNQLLGDIFQEASLLKDHKNILKQKKSVEFFSLESDKLNFKKNTKSLETNFNTMDSVSDEFDDSQLNEFLTVSLISNAVNIIKTSSSMTSEAVMFDAFQNNLEYTEKILLSGILNNDEKLVKECVVCYEAFFQNDYFDINANSFWSFYKSSGKSALLLSSCSFNLSILESTRLTLLQTLEKIMKYRVNANKLIFENKTFKTEQLDSFVFEHLHEVLFRSIFVNLTVNDIKGHNTLRSLCALYMNEIDYYCIYKDVDLSSLTSCYYVFAKSIATCNNVFGSIAFQRHIRANILKYIDRPSKALFDCFLVLTDKVFDMSIVGQENLIRDDQTRFRNYCGITASFIGVFKVKFLPQNSINQVLENQEHLLDSRIEFFIEKQCELLDSPDLLTRENSKDILSSELHPGVFSILFEKLIDKLNVFTEMCKRGEIEKNFFLLEQVLAVMRSILEREDISLIILCTKAVLEIVQKVLDIISLMEYNTHYKYKIIIHTSKVILHFKYAEKFFLIKGAHGLKNHWLQIIFNWFNSVAFVDLDLQNLTKSHREMDLEKRDLDYLRLDTSIECAKTLSFLTENISLEAPLATTAVDFEISKRSSFANYFNILLKALKRSSNHESVPFVLKHKTLLLNENVLSCLTNLLSSTPDIGLDFVLPITFSENTVIRKTLLDVLIRLIKNIPKDKTILSPIQEDAIVMLMKQVEKSPQILNALSLQCPVNEVERLATSLLKVCSPKNITHLFISDLIDEEISKVARNMDILRRNSLATRSLAIFSRVKGTEFLKKTIMPLVLSVVVEKLDFEIEKPITNPGEREVHMSRFIDCMDNFCDNTLTSFDLLPVEFLYISQRIYASAKEKFPGSELIAVGSFIFLRFFCPAIVNPETENIKDRISSKNRRTLILIAKVLQNLANNTINSLKWPLLEAQKSKIDEWSAKMFSFLKDVSDPTRVINIKVNYSAPIGKVENIGSFHKLLYSHYLELRTNMIVDIADFKSFDGLIEACKVIDEAMLVLGQPKLELSNNIPKIIRDNSEKYSLVYDFMNRYYLKVGTTPEVSGLLFVSSDTDGIPSMNISLRLMESESIDVNEIVYKLIYLESALWDKKFNIFLDGTAASVSSIDKLESIMGLFLNLVPRDSLVNLNSVIFYNINENFLIFWWKQAKKVREMFGHGNIKHKFYTSNCSASVFKTLQLQKYSSDIYNDVRVTIYNTSYYEASKNRFVPVTLKIGNHNIQLVRETPKRIKFSDAENVSECHFNDIYFIKDLATVSVTHTTGIPCEFTLIFNNGKTLILSTQKYLEILKILHYAKNKIIEENKLGEPVTLEVKKENTNDIELEMVVRIALVALSGFCNKDADVRAKAYSLLAVTQNTFFLETGYNIYPNSGVSLPDDTLVLTKTVTKFLAINHPEMTYFALKHVFEEILANSLDVDKVQALSLVSYWAENFYEHVLMDASHNGKERATLLIRLLIKCTLEDSLSMNSFKIFIWAKLLLVSDLLEIITDEVITHAMDRESEGFDWVPCISILSMIPSVQISGIIVQRLLKLINKLIPTLTNDNSVNSWSEVVILVLILQDLSFDSYASFEGYVPEILYIISMLIDVRPIKIKTSLLKILINICNSFITSSGDFKENKKSFEKCIQILTSARAKYVFGLSRDSTNSYYSSSAATLLSKVSYMSELINYILLIIQIINKDESDNMLWKAKYKDLILEAIFGEESYISARAMMYLSILCKEGVYEDLMKNLFSLTLNVLADVSNTEEAMLHLVTHIVSYGNFVTGISDNNPKLIIQISWLCHSFFMSPNAVVFHAGLVASTSCLEKLLSLAINTGLIINDEIWKSNRQGLGDCLDELESIDQRFNSKDNFIFTHVHFITKATIVAHTRSYGIRFLKLNLRLAAHENKDQLQISNSYNVFMFLYFILESENEFINFFKELNNGEIPVWKHLNKDFEIPEFLLTWLKTPDDEVKNIVLYQITLLASVNTLSDSGKLKILNIAQYMAESHPLVFFEFMNNIIDECSIYQEKATMADLISKSFELSTIIVTSEYYSEINEFEKRMTNRLKDMRLEALSSLQLFQHGTVGFNDDEHFAMITIKRRRSLLKILEKIVIDDSNTM
ncbi:hypothetical protein QEN19_000075 [Hanseniaspora menglaensis]